MLQASSEVYGGSTNVVYHHQQGYAKNGSYEQHRNGKQESHFIRNGGNHQSNGTADSLTNGHKSVMDLNGRKDLKQFIKYNMYFNYVRLIIYAEMMLCFSVN